MKVKFKDIPENCWRSGLKVKLAQVSAYIKPGITAQSVFTIKNELTAYEITNPYISKITITDNNKKEYDLDYSYRVVFERETDSAIFLINYKDMPIDPNDIAHIEVRIPNVQMDVDCIIDFITPDGNTLYHHEQFKHRLSVLDIFSSKLNDEDKRYIPKGLIPMATFYERLDKFNSEFATNKPQRKATIKNEQKLIEEQDTNSLLDLMDLD